MRITYIEGAVREVRARPSDFLGNYTPEHIRDIPIDGGQGGKAATSTPHGGTAKAAGHQQIDEIGKS